MKRIFFTIVSGAMLVALSQSVDSSEGYGWQHNHCLENPEEVFQARSSTQPVNRQLAIES